jgi:glycolate oxidase FAD binding subunit
VEAIGVDDGVRIVGGRTNWSVGRRADGAGEGVREVCAPNGVVAVEPAELIVRVGAGTPIGVLDEALSAARLQCPLDPLVPSSSTVGGTLSVGRSGNRRLRHGHLRDVLLEAQYVAADGVLRRAGAPLVKNVTGFDLCRLLVGSLGSLAALGEVVLRCQPAPDVRAWFMAEGADPWAVRTALFRPSSILWDGMCTYVQLEGSPEEVHAERRSLPGVGWSEISAPPMPSGRAVLSAGEARTLREERALPLLRGGTFLIEIGVGVVHGVERALEAPDPRALAMHRQVKDAFDPAGRMNPGVLPW